jgi:hypothetical protein
VQLDVLPVGDVGHAATELRRDRGDRAQLGVAQLATGDAYAKHEELVVEFLRLEDCRLAAVDAGAALCVEAPPPHPPAQVGGINAGETGLRVDVLDPGADVEPVVVFLRPLVGVERLEMAEGPLALPRRTTPRAGSAVGAVVGGPGIGHGRRGTLRRLCGRGAGARVSGCETDGAGDAREVDVATGYQRRTVAHATSVSHWAGGFSRASGCATACRPAARAERGLSNALTSPVRIRTFFL